MNVVANGRAVTLHEGATVADLLQSIGWRSEWVVVERNGETLERALHSSTAVREGDRLEIVRAVAGGAG